MRQTVLALDLGTSQVKGLLLAEDGVTIAKAKRSYPTRLGPQGEAEQDPMDWVSAVTMCVKDLAISAKKQWPPAICSVTGQMHGLVLIGKQGRPLRPAIICSDFRAHKELEKILGRIEPERIVGITGNPPLAMFPGPKLLWVKTHEPSIYAAVNKILPPKDYVGYVMTGEIATDPSDASGTMLYNVHSGRWDEEMCEASEVCTDWLPPIRSAKEIRGKVCKQFAEDSGVREGTPVIVGGGDLPSTVLGCGVNNSKDVGFSLGTAGIVFRLAKAVSQSTTGQLFNFVHILPRTLVSMGSCPGAGFSVKWFETAILGRQGSDSVPHSNINRSVPEGKPTLFFLPFLLGTGSPFMDYKARGGFIGVAHHHTSTDLRRAILEGVSFSLRQSYDLLKIEQPEVRHVLVCGGGAYNRVWLEILASVIGSPLSVLQEKDAAVLGAGILGGVAAEWFSTADEAIHMCVKTSGIIEPSREWVDFYSEKYQRYLQICELIMALRSKRFWE